jgi:2-iminobutanoate/2-iminopropanoate deaminase
MGRTEGGTNRSPAPVGPYRQAARTGQLVPVAGHAGVDPLTGEVAFQHRSVPELNKRQTTALTPLLPAARLWMISSESMYLASMEDLEDMKDADARGFLSPYPAPTKVAVGAARRLKAAAFGLAASTERS